MVFLLMLSTRAVSRIPLPINRHINGLVHHTWLISFITVLKHKRLCFAARIIAPVTWRAIRTFSGLEYMGVFAVGTTNFSITCHAGIIAEISGLTHYRIVTIDRFHVAKLVGEKVDKRRKKLVAEPKQNV